MNLDDTGISPFFFVFECNDGFRLGNVYNMNIFFAYKCNITSERLM